MPGQAAEAREQRRVPAVLTPLAALQCRTAAHHYSPCCPLLLPLLWSRCADAIRALGALRVENNQLRQLNKFLEVRAWGLGSARGLGCRGVGWRLARARVRVL